MKTYILLSSLLISSFAIAALGGDGSEIMQKVYSQKETLAACVEKQTGIYPLITLNAGSLIEDDYFGIQIKAKDVNGDIDLQQTLLFYTSDQNSLSRQINALCGTLSYDINEILAYRGAQEQYFLTGSVNFLNASYDKNTIHAQAEWVTDGGQSQTLWLLYSGNQESTACTLWRSSLALQHFQTDGKEKVGLVAQVTPFTIHMDTATPYASMADEILSTELRLVFEPESTNFDGVALVGWSKGGEITLLKQKEFAVIAKILLGMQLGVSFSEQGFGSAAVDTSLEINLAIIISNQLLLSLGGACFVESGTRDTNPQLPRNMSEVLPVFAVSAQVAYALGTKWTLAGEVEWQFYGEDQNRGLFSLGLHYAIPKKKD